MRQSKPTAALFASRLNNSNKPLDLHAVLQILAERESQRLHFRSLSMSRDSLTSNDQELSPTRSTINRLRHPFGQKSEPATDSTTNALVDHYSISIGCHPGNMGYNRYMDIQPYDRTRVKMAGSEQAPETPGSGTGRYLNASWVLEYFGHKWWIAAQAPLPGTAHAFLSLVWDGCITPLAQTPTPLPTPSLTHAPRQLGSPSAAPTPSEFQFSQPRTRTRPRTIVQLTRNIEGGRRKAHEYFPDIVGQSATLYPESTAPPQNPNAESSYPFPRSSNEGPDPVPLSVTLVSQKELPEARCVWSTLTVTAVDANNTSSTSTQPTRFHHLLYYAWPDHGVPTPEDTESLVEFLKLVDCVNRGRPQQQVNGNANGNANGSRLGLGGDIGASDMDNDPDPPIIINCSAGIGRTGSFIALSSLLRSHSVPSSQSSAPSVLPAAYAPIPPSFILDSPLGALPGGGSPTSHKDDIALRILQEIDFLREQRPGMVQRDEQVRLVWEVVGRL